MSKEDPIRWCESASGASPELQQWLRSAQSDLGSERELAAVAAAIGPLIDAPVGSSLFDTANSTLPEPSGSAVGGSATTAGSAGAGSAGAGTLMVSGALFKALGIGVVVAASGGLWYAARVPPQTNTPASAPPAAAASVSPTAEAPRVGTAVVSPSVPGPPPTPTPSEITARQPASVEPSPSARSRAPAPARRSAAQNELGLLGRARAALTEQPARALRLARQHGRSFPNSQFAQEREVIAIEALRRLGREQAAQNRADHFKRQFPDSAHNQKVGNSGE